MGQDPPAPRDGNAERRLQRQRTRDTAPEMALRQEVHRRGLRYRVDRQPCKGIRRRADIVFPRESVAVFVDGCFWHACPQHVSWPEHNSAWWRHKLCMNIERDRDTDERLDAAGWTVVRLWEHEIREDAAAAADRVCKIVKERRQR